MRWPPTPRPTPRLLLAAALLAAGLARAEPPAEIPVTTASPEARDLYLRGRAAAERLRVEDARRLFAQAVARDPGFALAHLALANSAATGREFFDEEARAVALAGGASPGERQVILGQDAGLKGDLVGQRQHYAALVETFPGDARARMLLGNFHFGQQDYPLAIAQYREAIAADPAFSQAWNQLGYAHRFAGQYPEAEQAFRRYVELVPGEPNPHDSHAELLMKMGRFQESIEAYQKALALDPHFVASYVGIAHDQLAMGKPALARRTLARLRDRAARTDGERRQALFWTAASHVHQGHTDQALAACRALMALGEKSRDRAAVSGDHLQAGQILLQAGRTRAARRELDRAVLVMDGAAVPAEVKENARRNHLYFEALLALAEEDGAAAAQKAEAYRAQAAAHALPFELRRVHELDGLLALRTREYVRAAQELSLANQRDPWVLYQLALAHQARGDREGARAAAQAAAEFNELNFNWAFAREKARKLRARLG